MQPSDLHVISVYNNFRRFKARLSLCQAWLERAIKSGASVTLVELSVGERPFDFCPRDYPSVNFVQLRGDPEHEIWMRDSLVMAAFKSLPKSAKYICWEDADVDHLRPDWVMETLHTLQLYRLCQTWTHSIDLDPQGNIAANEWGNEVDRSFCAAWLAGDVEITPGNYAPSMAMALLDPNKARDWRSHTGYSWAVRRDTFEAIGGLIDWMVTGASDWHMALGFCGKLRQMVHDCLDKGEASHYSDGYYLRLLDYADKCDKFVKQDIGVVSGTLAHGWHGSKKLRMYGSREAILTESHFDPDRDLVTDDNGLLRLSGANTILRDGLRRYSSRRNEDSVDIY